MPISAAGPLAQLIDDYVSWLVAWHRFSLSTAETRGQALEALRPPESFSAWRENAFAALAQDQPAVERIVAAHEQLHTLAKLVAMKTPTGRPPDSKDDESVLAKYRELMQGLRRLEQAFAVAASGLDSLTGLRSRAGLQQDLDRELNRYARTARSFCIAIMDIDHFKKVNDTYGHEGGDRVLAAVADHISRTLRAHDDAYRLGGEEFLLCLKEADPAAGVQILERLRVSLKEKPVLLPNGEKVPLTASFGLASCDHDATIDELLRRADRALYRAKNEGRDRILVAED